MEIKEKDVSNTNGGEEIGFALRCQVTMVNTNIPADQDVMLVYKDHDKCREMFVAQKARAIEENYEREGYTFEVEENEEDYYVALLTNEESKKCCRISIEMGILRDDGIYVLR